MDSDSEIGLKDLNQDEQIALAALLRFLVRLDGQFTEAEEAALEDVAVDFGEKSFWKLMDDVAAHASDEQGVRRAAERVTRLPAQELIFGVLLGVAQSDVVQGRESSLLDWLEEHWQLGKERAAYRE